MAKDATINEGGQEAQGTQGGTPSAPSAKDGEFTSTMELGQQAKTEQEAAAEPKKPEGEGDDKVKGTEKEPPIKKEGEETKEGEGAEDDKTKAKAKAKSPDEGKEKKGEEDRFDKNPRFQKLIRDKNEEKAAHAKTREELAELKGEFKSLKEQIGKATPAKGKDYENVLDKSADDIRALFLEDGGDIKSFLAGLGRQIRAEVIEDLEGKYVSEGKVKEIAKGALDDGMTEGQEKAQHKKIEAGYKAFADANEGFDEMWGSGDLEDYCDEHPEHTPISAYFVLKAEKDAKTLEEKVAEAVEAKREEIEKEVREELKTKKVTRSLGGGPASEPRSSADDPRLKNTKDHGGRTAVMTKRIQERRASQQ